MTAKTRKTPVIKPVVCECECLARPLYADEDHATGHAGTMAINGTLYTLTPLGRTTRDGYRLVNLDNGKVYDLDTSSGYPTCDCWDFIARRGSVEHKFCKHGTALIKLRREKKI